VPFVLLILVVYTVVYLRIHVTGSRFASTRVPYWRRFAKSKLLGIDNMDFKYFFVKYINYYTVGDVFAHPKPPYRPYRAHTNAKSAQLSICLCRLCRAKRRLTDAWEHRHRDARRCR
jgi:hypothetical protein